MTQKHFIAIAQELVDVRTRWLMYYGPDAYKSLISFCIELCNTHGARFDINKFTSYLRNRGVSEI